MREHCVVLGNGRSRLHFDLYKIKERYVTYGCNAIYRDFMPDTLVSMDMFMVDEIIKSKAHYNTHFVTQHTNNIDKLAANGEPIHFLKHMNSTPDSGTAAIRLASEAGYKLIYLLGFDYHNGKFNNIYAGTPNYSGSNHVTPHSQDTSWRTRLNKIINDNTDTLYVRVTDEENISEKTNFQHMTIEKFKEKY